MTVHIQLDLPAIEQAASASGAAGIGLRDHLAGLVLMYHHVWTKKTDRATRELLMGWFAVGPQQVERLAAGLVAFEHLATTERTGAELPPGVWRIKGAKRYENLRKAFSEGGKKSRANLKQYATAEQPEQPAPAKGGVRALSEQEECWDVLEQLRVEHCVARGLEPGASKKPKLCNARLLKAVEAVGIVDSIANGKTFTRWDMLTLLFEHYLGQERIGLQDREGNACTPPWPIDLFLTPGVLGRFKEDYEEAA